MVQREMDFDKRQMLFSFQTQANKAIKYEWYQIIFGTFYVPIQILWIEKKKCFHLIK